MIKKWKSLSNPDRIKHVILYLIGVGIMPLGVVLTINAHLGSGGYDALNFAIAEKLGINTSIAIYSTAFLVLILTAVIRKGFPRFQTFISSFLLGFFTDVWKTALQNIEGTTLASSVIIMCIGLVVISFAVACYIISIFPTNPTDDLIVALNEKGWKIRWAKITLDVVCVVLALILGGEIGAGTIICTFGLGPAIDIFHKLVMKACKFQPEKT
jgi:Predicted membrane protein